MNWPLSVLLLSLLKSTGTNQSTPSGMTLAQALSVAERTSPILLEAKAEADAAKFGARSAKVGMSPKVSVHAFGSSSQNGSIMSSTPGVDPSALMLVPSGGFLDGNLSVMIPILAPRLRAMSRQASYQINSADAELAEVHADVVFQVTEAFSKAVMGRQVVAAEAAKVTAAEELVRTSRDLFDVGKGIEATVQRSQAELSRSKRSLMEAENEAKKAVLDLLALIGSDLASEVLPVGDNSSIGTIAPLASLISWAEISRPRIASEKAKLETASWDVSAAKGQLSPQLYGSLMGDITDRKDMGGVTAGLVMSIPIFDGGQLRAEVSKAESMRTKARATLKVAELSVEKEVRQAWLDSQTADASIQSSETAVQAAKTALGVMTIRVQAGKSILLEQLDAIEALREARADLAKAHFDSTMARAKLVRAVGRGL